MTILQNFQQIFETVSANPIQYRIECMNVAVNTNMGLYEQELNSEGMSIYMLLKILIQKCSEWQDVEKVAKALEDFYNYFLIEKCIDIARTEVLLKLAVHRGYISKGELGFLISEKEFLSLQNTFKNLGSEFLNEPPTLVSIRL
jgi:hypothetical protein